MDVLIQGVVRASRASAGLLAATGQAWRPQGGLWGRGRREEEGRLLQVHAQVHLPGPSSGASLSVRRATHAALHHQLQHQREETEK